MDPYYENSMCFKCNEMNEAIKQYTCTNDFSSRVYYKDCNGKKNVLGTNDVTGTVRGIILQGFSVTKIVNK